MTKSAWGVMGLVVWMGGCVSLPSTPTAIVGDDGNGGNGDDTRVDDTALSTEDFDGDGYSEVDGDCDDDNEFVHPGAAEDCNAIDDNCNGEIDDGRTWLVTRETRDANGTLTFKAFERYHDPDRMIEGEADVDGDGQVDSAIRRQWDGDNLIRSEDDYGNDNDPDVVEINQYNSAGLVSSEVNDKAEGLNIRYGFTYNGDGDMSRLDVYVDGGASPLYSINYSYTYDAGELVSQLASTDADGLEAVYPERIKYQYNSNGDIVSMITDMGVIDGTPTTSTSYSYRPNGKLKDARTEYDGLPANWTSLNEQDGGLADGKADVIVESDYGAFGRTAQRIDLDGDGSIDQSYAFTYDGDPMFRTRTFDAGNDGSIDETTTQTVTCQ